MRIRAHSKALPSIPKPVGSWPQRMRRCAARLTAHPSAEWIVQQLTEAYGWQQAPRYIIRDRGLRLWRCLRPPASSHGYTKSADRTTVTMAERMCGEAGRLDPAGFS
jgi:hypothetical protein